MDCKNCKYGIVTSGRQVLRQGNTTITMVGENNVNCSCKTIKSMVFKGDKIICSSFSQKCVDK